MNPLNIGQISQQEQTGGIEVYKPQVMSVKDEGLQNSGGDYIPKVQDEITKVWLGDVETKVVKYRMVTFIGGCTYVLKLDKQGEHTYNLSFKTIEYEYALTELSQEESEKLFKKIADLAESAYVDSEGEMEIISILPDGGSYSVEDIEGCIASILQKTDKYTEEQLRKDYKGNKIFNLYTKVMEGEHYVNASLRQRNEMTLRSRYFRIKLRRILQNWDIEEPFKNSTFFSLRRKDVS